MEEADRMFPSTVPEMLREIAAIYRARGRRSWRAYQSLSPESLEELADLLLAGKRPSLGWWQKHLRKEPS
jgi:hypothetical protein